MSFPNPRWLSEVPASERPLHLHVFRGKLARLYAYPGGAPGGKTTDARAFDKALLLVSESGASPLPVPAWAKNIPADERDPLLTRHFVEVAALYSNRSGSVMGLSRLLGFHFQSLSTLSRRPSLSVETAKKVEQIVGRRVLPWTTLCRRP